MEQQGTSLICHSQGKQPGESVIMYQYAQLLLFCRGSLKLVIKDGFIYKAGQIKAISKLIRTSDLPTEVPGPSCHLFFLLDKDIPM